MPPPALPVELTDTIIDHLYDNHTALAACSLACRAFRDAAQHHLLATILCVGNVLERLLAQLEIQDGPLRIEDDTIDSDNLDARSVVDKDVSRAADEKGLSEPFAQHVREVWFRGQRSTAHVFNVSPRDAECSGRELGESYAEAILGKTRFWYVAHEIMSCTQL